MKHIVTLLATLLSVVSVFGQPVGKLALRDAIANLQAGVPAPVMKTIARSDGCIRSAAIGSSLNFCFDSLEAGTNGLTTQFRLKFAAGSELDMVAIRFWVSATQQVSKTAGPTFYIPGRKYVTTNMVADHVIDIGQDYAGLYAMVHRNPYDIPGPDDSRIPVVRIGDVLEFLVSDYYFGPIGDEKFLGHGMNVIVSAFSTFRGWETLDVLPAVGYATIGGPNLKIIVPTEIFKSVDDNESNFPFVVHISGIDPTNFEQSSLWYAADREESLKYLQATRRSQLAPGKFVYIIRYPMQDIPMGDTTFRIFYRTSEGIVVADSVTVNVKEVGVE